MLVVEVAVLVTVLAGDNFKLLANDVRALVSKGVLLELVVGQALLQLVLHCGLVHVLEAADHVLSEKFVHGLGALGDGGIALGEGGQLGQELAAAS